MIPLFSPFINKTAIMAELDKCFDGYIATGPRVDQFAEKLGEEFSREKGHIIPTNSCTSALNLALTVLKNHIKPTYTPRVIANPLTCFAATSAILNQGFIPRWADVSYDNHLCLDLNDVENKLSENSRVVMWTSWGGVPPDFEEIKNINRRYYNKFKLSLYWIFDLAHAYGTLYKGRPLPSCLIENAFYCYSFGAIKTLVAGDGGAIVSPPEFSDSVEALSWYGLSRRNKCDFRAWSDITERGGSKYVMNDINAAIGLASMRSVGYNIYRSWENCQFYLKNIKNPAITLFPAHNFTGTSGWLFTILVDKRDKFTSYMKDNGIQVNGVHRPNHTLSVVKSYNVNLPYLDSIQDKYVCIPCMGHITREQVEHITTTINDYARI